LSGLNAVNDTASLPDCEILFCVLRFGKQISSDQESQEDRFAADVGSQPFQPSFLAILLFPEFACRPVGILPLSGRRDRPAIDGYNACKLSPPTTCETMLILLSPAKNLDFETAVKVRETTQPGFGLHSEELMQVVRRKSAADLSKLMKISEKLGQLNFERNQVWKTADCTQPRAAAYAFRGDVYQGLAIDEMTAPQVRRCQKHVRILSGLYGLLKPLDLIEPYRLEMGTRLKTERGSNLYDFWDDILCEAIRDEIADLKSKFVVNLASNEYSKAARLKQLGVPIIAPAFRENKEGEYKMISFFAKRARGMMTRFIVQNSVKTVEGLKAFDLDGYSWNEELSTPESPTFTR